MANRPSQYMIPAKKSLGQNFLKSKEALRTLIEAGNVTSEDIVLEVGPGKGVLTRELVQWAKKVIAVEKDSRLIELLHTEFKQHIEAGKLEIVEQDILDFNVEDFKKNLEIIEKEGKRSYKIIANIPYYITGTFLQKFLEADFQPETMVLMLQKEVADRIVARDGKESILSMSVKAYGTPKYSMTVKAKYFSPAPNVDSAIIAITNISKKFFESLAKNYPPSLTLEDSLNTQGNNSSLTIQESMFFEIIKLGFAHKRKMLVGNLSEKFAREKIVAILNKNSINEKARAEDLSLEDWQKIIPELI